VIGGTDAEKSFPLPAARGPFQVPASEIRIGAFLARRSKLPGGARRKNSPRVSLEMLSGSSFPGHPSSSATATRCWEPKRPTIRLPEAAGRRSSDDPALRPIAGRYSRYPEKRHTSGRSSGGRIACEARQKGGQSVNRWPQFGHFSRKIHDRKILTQPFTTS
jgi:hypothetical protein